MNIISEFNETYQKIFKCSPNPIEWLIFDNNKFFGVYDITVNSDIKTYHSYGSSKKQIKKKKYLNWY